MKHVRTTPVLSAIALACGMAVATPSLAADTIRIAFGGPVTGPVTQYGDMVKEGIYTAADIYNAAGGVNGKKIEVVEIDDACEPKQAPVAANRVIKEGIHFVVGHVCTGATVAAAPIYNNEGVVRVTPSATGPVLTDGKNYEFIFRTIGRDDQQGPAAVKFIVEKVQPKKVAVLHDKQSYGQGIAESVRDGLKAAGITPVIFEGINAGESDYSAVITKLKAAGVDFVYFGGYHPELGLLLRQGAEQGLKARFMSDEGAGNPDINAIAGDAVEGMLLTLPADFSAKPENAKVVEAFNAKGRNAGGAFQLSAYAATMAILESIKATGGEDPAKIAQYMHANSFATPIGEISWTPQGDLKSFDFVVYTWHKDGSKTIAEK